jgi:photosystem II stability/assembly factor-like uncharacterized protein
MARFYLLVCVVTAGITLLADAPALVSLGPFGGDVRSLAVHPGRPDRFFLGTSDGQIFVSTDSGDNWVKLRPGLRRRDLVVDNLVFDPRDPDTLYAAAWELRSSRGWLFRTGDGGVSWENVCLGSFRSAVRAVAISPSEPNTIALGITEGVLLSVDAGKTWDRITRGYRSMYNVESLAFDPRDSQTLYVGTWHLAFKTSDLGKKWTPIHVGMVEDSDLFSLLVNPQRPEVLYAGACTGVYRSVNAGGQWNRLRNGLPPDAIRTRALQLDPVDSSTIYAGTTVGLFVSRDEGASWRTLFGNVAVNAVTVHPSNPQIILAGTDDLGVLRSTDGGAAFHPANLGFVHRQVSAVASAPDSVYAAVTADREYGGFFYLRGDSRRWELWSDGLDLAAATITSILAPPGATEVVLATTSGVYLGTPGQTPWRLLESTQQLRVNGLSPGPAGASNLLVAADVGVLLVDITTGALQQLVIPVYNGSAQTVLFDRASERLFVGTRAGLFRSDDLGASWAARGRGLPSAPVLVLHRSGGLLFCGTQQGLFRSDDAGESWSPGQGVYPLEVAAIASAAAAPETVYASDSLAGRLFRSVDGGTNWSELGLEENSPRISQLAFSWSGELLAGTVSDGVCLIRDHRLDVSKPPAEAAEGAR